MRLYLNESFSIPKDGSFVVYEAATTPPQLWMRNLETAESRTLVWGGYYLEDLR